MEQTFPEWTFRTMKVITKLFLTPIDTFFYFLPQMLKLPFINGEAREARVILSMERVS